MLDDEKMDVEMTSVVDLIQRYYEKCIPGYAPFKKGLSLRIEKPQDHSGVKDSACGLDMRLKRVTKTSKTVGRTSRSFGSQRHRVRPFNLWNYVESYDSSTLQGRSLGVHSAQMQRIDWEMHDSYIANVYPKSQHRQFDVRWDDEVRIYLSENQTKSQVISRVLDRIIEISEDKPDLLGAQIQFLKDPDDSSRVILIRIITTSCLTAEGVLEYKSNLRSILTEETKALTDSKEDYVDVRASITIIMRGNWDDL